ncbi:Rad3-related DNA helicase [Cenarchaeum symbiosum A]|uniref:Rad3-related DNA helicase n=1 Tax=Cenarchaeum symbiosum (strain A) TaxID=414004 RepID=A0RU34_CENSY|nr:Rad3-related DNA helicase [Cenarchaeum symbiosum A]
MLKSFPGELVPRPIQKEILSEIDSVLGSGYTKIVLCAPTGSGKSPIAVALAAKFESSFVVTATKSLQDQYSRDFPMLKPVKGKDNFACPKLMEEDKFDMGDYPGAIRAGLTCNKGECIEKRVENGKEVERTCRFKPAIADYEKGPSGTVCPYYGQKYAALLAPHSIWNYASYFQMMKYTRKAYESYLDRKVAVFDEAHRIEDQIINFVGITIRASQVEECGLILGDYELGEIEGVTSLLDDLAGSYAKAIQEVQEHESRRPNPDYSKLVPLENKYERAARAKISVYSDGENFVVNDPQMSQGEFSSITLTPLDISGYVEDLCLSPYQVFMSATISRDPFCETTGIDPDKVAFVDVEHSPFSMESRRIEFMDIARLNYSSPPSDEQKVIKAIDGIMKDLHPGERGLILTSSIKRCYDILAGLSPSSKARVRLCHSTNEGGRTQDQVLAEHADTPGSVLLSASLWEGVDLKDDRSRFQIIAKAPYPGLGDKRTKIKQKKYPLWYSSQALTKLLQGFGRSIRNEDDRAVTYVLDSGVKDLIRRARRMVPKSYHDVLKFEHFS